MINADNRLNNGILDSILGFQPYFQPKKPHVKNITHLQVNIILYDPIHLPLITHSFKILLFVLNIVKDSIFQYLILFNGYPGKY